MSQHPNAALTVRQRRLLVARIQAGMPIAHAAKEFHVSRPTARKWWARYQAEGDAGLADRSCRPATTPHRTPLATERRVVRLRRRYRWGPDQIAGYTGVPRATVGRILLRYGINDRRRLLADTSGPPSPPRRYERSRPGELVHVDVKKLGRIPDGGGWRTLGHVHGRANRPVGGGGFDYVHAAVDDRSRLAYCEILPNETAETCAAFWRRAAGWYAKRGIAVKEVMTDNAFAYVQSHAFAAALRDTGVRRHVRTRPYRPQTNGKVERFNRTLAEEWAYARHFATNHARHAALGDWLHWYNHHRTHAAIGAPPITRVNNAAGIYT